MRTSTLCIALFLAWLALPGQVAAADSAPGTPDCASSPACQKLCRQAKEQSRRDNLGETLRLYKAAYQVRADPVLLFNLARVLHKQGQLKEAADYYQQYLHSSVADAEQREKAQEYLNQLRGPAQAPPSPAEVPGPEPAPPTPLPSLQPPSLSSPPGPGAGPDVPAAATPRHKKWWLWTLVGGAVVAGAVGLGVGLAARSATPPQSPGLPSGINLYQPSF